MDSPREGRVLVMTERLPPRVGYDVAALGRLFERTTNSYKLVFFQALLQLMKARDPNDHPSLVLSLRELIVEMLAIAWYPHRFFRLSFGVHDQIGRILDRLDFNVEERAVTNPATVLCLRDQIQEQFEVIGAFDLARYVPYRLLSPFFSTELQGHKDGVRDSMIRQLASTRFDSKNPPLYRFRTNEDAIELHPDWAGYLANEFPILLGWVRYHWIRFLQIKNPSTPSIAMKVAPPVERSSLLSQRRFWQEAIRATPIRCIYSHEKLTADGFSLDHYVPWSFVCHDLLWNLIPCRPSSNSAKGNRLPPPGTMNGFIALHHEALRITERRLSQIRWNRLVEPYMVDLRLPPEDLLSSEKLDRAYRDLLPPLLNLARQQGFSEFACSSVGEAT
jgi:hypothetical protein